MLLNILLEEWEMIRIVAEELQVIEVNKRIFANFSHRSMLFSISGIVIVVPSSVLISFDIFLFGKSVRSVLKLIIFESEKTLLMTRS